MFQSPIRDLTQGLGFTLIELMLALGLLLVLGLIARPTYQEYVERGYQLQAQADLLACAQRLHRVALRRNSYSGHADTNGDGMGDADTGLVAASVCPHVRSESSQYVVTIRSVADEFELIAMPREEVGNSRPGARVVGVRVSIRSTSVHGLSEFANIPLVFRGARTFMLPQFAQQGWQL